MSKISYSEIHERNIFDTRFTGGGKTTSALEYLHTVVPNGHWVIVLMQSYERLQSNYLSHFDDALKERTILFKGKTQEGLCKYSQALRDLSSKDILAKTMCASCDERDTCEYQKQVTRIRQNKDSNEGCCILTTEKNLPIILKDIASKNPDLLIDDIPLSVILSPEIKISSHDLSSLQHYLQKYAEQAGKLNELISKIKDYKKDDDTAIGLFIDLNKGDLFKELELFKVGTSGKGAFPHHTSMKIASELLYHYKQKNTIHFYQEPDYLKIVIDTSNNYQSNRVIYLNATPTQKDEYCINHLGDVKRIEGKAPESKNYFIFQITDSATSRQAILDPRKIKTDFLAITDIFKEALAFTNQKFLLFTFNAAYEKWVTAGILSGLSYSPEIYFGDATRGTNEYKDYPISMIVGTPYYPPEYFLHPAFEGSWKQDDVYETERKKSRYVYRVPRDISKEEALINLLQMIGRNLRESSDSPDAVKVVFVFSDIDIALACKVQNGGSVYPIKIRQDIQIIQGKKKGTPTNFNAFKKACQKALRPSIIRGIENHIDKILLNNPDMPHSLETAASELQAQINIYSTQNIKDRIIRPLYEIENKEIINNGKTINTAFIVKKKQ